MTNQQYFSALEAFHNSWKELFVVEYDDLVTMHAQSLFPLYGLRAGDVVQLASAVVARHVLQIPVEFMTYDKKLWAAARDHGLTSLPSDLLTK